MEYTHTLGFVSSSIPSPAQLDIPSYENPIRSVAILEIDDIETIPIRTPAFLEHEPSDSTIFSEIIITII
jgi:hypothetical protein